FQAEDGIRDIGVTGVQTCALPIFPPVTFFVLLSAAAWAGIISSDLGAFTFHWLSSRAAVAVAALLGHHEFGTLALSLHLLCLFFFFHGLQKEEESKRVFFDAPHQSLKQLVGLLFIFHERIALAVSAEPNAFLEVVHRKQVILPLRVND